MKIDTLMRHFREAYRGVRRNTWMSFAAISAVAVTLFIFGIFLVFAFNVRYMAAELDKQMAVRVALKMELTNDQQNDVVEQVKKMPGVKNAEFIPKAQGLRQMKEQWGKEGDEVFKGLEGNNNPLPDLILVHPANPKELPELAKKLEGIPGVDNAEAGGDVTERLLNASSWFRNIVLVFGLGLAILAAFLISNTIKLTIIARKREIEIMRLVGASNWFIRWPFFIEGAFIGMAGAVFPIILVLATYQVIYSALGGDEASSILKMMPMLSLSAYVAVSIFALGMAIGVWGSILSVRRFLKI
ncbi:permease-like cell division protein FtsX [Staphylospora marina]|uniref:permease-like cell division protein FtsX n=1 Tax=Staphylospora marina TaxID=2490858 RepID=UPI000F5C26A9|nr:permease-like cell division protein FtsX [Staphylospora marina]